MKQLSTSTANATWNIIEDDEAENDVASKLPKTSSLLQNKIIRQKGQTMNKTHSNPKFHGVPPSSSVMRRNTPSSKYSYKLQNMLQTDLRMGSNSTISPPMTTSGLTRNLSNLSVSQHRRKKCKISLQDEFSHDMQILLKSLHSNEFVGTIHPQHHARYISPHVSEQSLM